VGSLLAAHLYWVLSVSGHVVGSSGRVFWPTGKVKPRGEEKSESIEPSILAYPAHSRNYVTSWRAVIVVFNSIEGYFSGMKLSGVLIGMHVNIFIDKLSLRQ